MIKHIFIGLGGSGVRTLSEVKFRIYERTIAESGKNRFETMNDNYRFIFVDTDRKDVDAANFKYRTKYEGGTRQFIDFTELINIGDENSRQIYNKATTDLERHRVIRESVDEDVITSIGDFNLSSGASAVRMVSRLAFINKSNKFYETLIDNIEALRNNTTGLEIKYWVVSSCCGGTGSGILNDVLYYVNMAKKMVFGDGDPAVGLYLYTPYFFCNQVSEDILHRMRCNAVAVFKELGILNEWAHDEQKNKNIHQYVDSLSGIIDRQKGYRPFDYLIPIDYNTDKGGNLGTQDALYSTAAELIFYTHDGNGASGLDSVVNNYRMSTFRNSSDKYIISIGYSTVRKPVEEFCDYMTIRSQYEILRHGIVGDQYPSELYKQHAFNLFNKQILSAFANFDNDMVKAIENEVNINMAKEDDSDEVRYKIPEWMHNGLGQNAINRLNEIANLNPNEGKTRNGEQRKADIIGTIENNLTDWMEGATRTNGLNYVYGVLLELDTYCTLLYKALALGDTSISLDGIARTKLPSSALFGKIEELRKAAEKITPLEWVKKDGTDIVKYLEGLIGWADARRFELYDSMLTAVLKELAFGDDGLIDRLRNKVLVLKGAAEKTANARLKDFDELKAAFRDKKLDKKTHYLPDITEFVQDGRWLAATEGNVYAKWYEYIVSQINTADGRMPDRNKDSQHSLEAFFNNMVAMNKDEMEAAGYYLGNKSRLFTRGDDKPCGRVIEDILNYVDKTMHELIDGDPRIKTEWSQKKIVDLVNDLTSQEQLALRDANIPTYFFPNDKSNTPGGLRHYQFTSTGDNTTAMKVFPIANANECLPADNENVMYRMVAQIGMPYTSYLNYSTYEDTYNRTTNKELVHFHRMFADINNVQLPVREEMEMPVFIKYLLLDKMANIYEDVIFKGNGEHDKENCAKTPLIIDGRVIQIATRKSLSVIAGETIELRIVRGQQRLFDEVVINDENHFYVEFYKSFVRNFATSRYEAFVDEFIRSINYLNLGGAIKRGYKDAYDALYGELNSKMNTAKGKEQVLLQNILNLLSSNFRTADQFLK